MTKARRDLKPARAGDVLLMTVPGYWGKGATIAEAEKNVRIAGGLVSGQWSVRSVHPKTELDELGLASYPYGHVPILLATHKGKA
jgi:hypothetical protein